MFKKVLNKIKSFASGTLTKITAILILSVIIITVYAIVNNFFYINRYKDLIISNYSRSLSSFLTDTEESMYTIIGSAKFMSYNSDINYMLNTKDSPISNSDIRLSGAKTILNQSVSFSNLIDSVIIYNKAGDFIVTSSGLYDAKNYFETLCKYENYDYSYWHDYRVVTNSIKVLPPTLTSQLPSPDYSKTIIPMIFAASTYNNSSNMIIFNINAETLFEHFETNKLTANTTLYMVDNYTSKIYNAPDSVSVPEYTHISIVSNGSKSNSEMVSINGKKYLMVKSTYRSNLWGYSYMAAVPYSDINDSASHILSFSFVSTMILFISLLIFFVFGTNILWAPWQSLANTVNRFNAANIKNANIAQLVNTTLVNMENKNKTLENNLSITLPLSQEKYLIDILNDKSETNDNDEILVPLGFKYDFFVSVSINIDLNPSVVNSDSEITYSILMKEICRIIKAVFSNSFITYELSSTSNTQYLLLNLENDSYFNDIEDTIDQIKDLFVEDAYDIDITFGIGNIYEGFDGLKQTHSEAVSNMMKAINASKVQLLNTVSEDFKFLSNSENILSNYIIAGYFDKARHFLSGIFENTATNSESGKKQVYTNIIITLHKVANTKNISLTGSSSNDISNILQATSEFSEDEMQAYILSIIDSFEKSIHVSDTKLNISDVIDYINEHYTEDLYLEQLAQMYNTSAKYLSKRFKQYLDMSFKDYLTTLRINKAKELLKSGDIKLSELYQHVGFQNRSAFIRAFKIKVGLTPSEYKNASV